MGSAPGMVSSGATPGRISTAGPVSPVRVAFASNRKSADSGSSMPAVPLSSGTSAMPTQRSAPAGGCFAGTGTDLETEVDPVRLVRLALADQRDLDGAELGRRHPGAPEPVGQGGRRGPAGRRAPRERPAPAPTGRGTGRPRTTPPHPYAVVSRMSGWLSSRPSDSHSTRCRT